MLKTGIIITVSRIEVTKYKKMKKLGISLIAAGAFFFGVQNMQAQEEGEMEVEEVVEMEMEQDEFVELDLMALPQAVKDALLTDYNGAVAEEAWVKAKGEMKIYKLKINVKGETQKVLIDQDGNWLKEDEMIEKENK